jgi:SEC-C motif-containing protein
VQAKKHLWRDLGLAERPVAIATRNPCGREGPIIERMPRGSKIGRNDPCPCVSGQKFKHCCSGKIDWETILSDGLDNRPYLSVRGRNLYFATLISDALKLNALGKSRSLRDYKAAFTAAAVRKIHEAVMEVWPPNIDVSQALRRKPGDVSGLYIGDYGEEYLSRGIVRHSIYANKILLIDPFIYPRSVRDEFNPILNPEQYRAQTLKNVNLWFGLLPWIDAGIVEIIRPPSDFDSKLNWDLMTAQAKKYEENEDLREASKESVDELSSRHSEKLTFQQLLLGAPDSYLRRMFKERGLAKDWKTVDEFLKFVQRERDRDPDFLEPLDMLGHDQLFMISSGASYPSARLAADITGSYLFTDIRVKWKEIELDREAQNAKNRIWAPFAKAIQETQFRYLNNLRLDHALMIRSQGRLESLRTFLRKVWKDASTADQFASENAVLLSEELTQRIRDAEVEWKQIDNDLLKVVSGAAFTGLLAAGPLIATGHASFLAAAVGVAGIGSVVNSTRKRWSFADRFPAAFFMKVESDEN